MIQRLDLIAENTLHESLAVQKTIFDDKSLLSLIITVGKKLAEAFSSGHKVLLFGNGGSAADAQHIAAEFVGRYKAERHPLPALALTADTSAVTAIGNDYSFDDIFARPLEALGSKGDVAIGISTSGKSPNVLRGLAAARAKGLLTVAFAGRFGGMMKDQADYCICVPADTTARIQEIHTLIGHILCDIVESLLVTN